VPDAIPSLWPRQSIYPSRSPTIPTTTVVIMVSGGSPLALRTSRDAGKNGIVESSIRLMAISTQSEKERKRRIVAGGRIQGKAQAAIAREAGCSIRHVQRLSAEPETQLLIRDLLAPYRARLQQLVPKAIRAVERGLVAQKVTRSNHAVQLHAVRRAKDLLVLAQGELPPPVHDEPLGQITWEEYLVMYHKRMGTTSGPDGRGAKGRI